jgi:hypothetical protein
MIVGAGALSLAFGMGSATAAVKYHHRHLTKQSMQAPAARADNYATLGDTHNPAKNYPSRHMADGAIKTSTLPASGNNPAKPYAVRHTSANAAREATLPQNGNNPAKHYKSTAATTGSASR